MQKLLNLWFNETSENSKNENPNNLQKPLKTNPNSPKQPDNSKKILLNIITLLFFIGFVSSILLVSERVDKTENNIKPFSDLITEIRSGKVSKIQVSENKEFFVVQVYENDEKNREKVKKDEYYRNITSDSSSPLKNINDALGENTLNIGSGSGEIIYEEIPKQWYSRLVDTGALWYIIMILVFLGIAVFFVRKVSETNSRAISFGNTKARVFEELDNKDKITFKDVAGNEEAKLELMEVVDFLKRGEEYVKMGASIPKGVLLVGSPGNGKTLMAKAVAGEAKVPFFYVSGSEFVEMFVGVGAGRVRDLFKRAKKKAPCVVFIDEIDAVGRQRGVGVGGGNDEREQTLNQILVEMDGFEPTQSVIVIGATNRPDVLDPALLRPGRFDRQVTVTAPDRKEREKILAIHARNKILDKDVDLEIVAKRTPGFSGADLMNVLNEAAILAVRERRQSINNTILREAIEKVALGPSLKSKIITPKQKKLTAFHEAGHALIATVLPKASKVQKVTIIPRGRAAGYTFHSDNDGDALTKTKSEFLASIVVLFGGYVVEEIIFKDLSTGASSDLSKATEIATDMVRKYGMSELGPITFDNGKNDFLGRDTGNQQNYSQEVASKIDMQISLILGQCYKECKQIIGEYREYLDKIADALIEKEVLELEEFNEIVKDILVNEDQLVTGGLMS
jgi:cell division protease FtsH